MRRFVVPVLSLAMVLCLTVPSQGWWLIHHPHAHYVHPPHRLHYAAQPVAVPLTVGFQLPGGVGVNLTPDGSILHQLLNKGSQPPSAGAVTVNSDVAATLDRIGTKTTNAADKLDGLLQSINKGLSDTDKLGLVERAKDAKAAVSDTGTKTGVKGVVPVNVAPK